jgi:hypothetical protein
VLRALWFAGFCIIPGMLSRKEQEQILYDALMTFPSPPSTTNHTLAYGPLPSLWQAATQVPSNPPSLLAPLACAFHGTQPCVSMSAFPSQGLSLKAKKSSMGEQASCPPGGAAPEPIPAPRVYPSFKAGSDGGEGSDCGGAAGAAACRTDERPAGQTDELACWGRNGPESHGSRQARAVLSDGQTHAVRSDGQTGAILEAGRQAVDIAADGQTDAAPRGIDDELERCWAPHADGPTAARLLQKLRWATLGPPFVSLGLRVWFQGFGPCKPMRAVTSHSIHSPTPEMYIFVWIPGSRVWVRGQG